jgi:hypothetical protein
MPSLTQDDLDQARSLEGSVFDDTWSKLRRFGASDPSGGLGANPMGGMGVGIVRNEAHPAFRGLQRMFPAEAEHLQKSPSIIRYASTDPKELSDAGASAMTIPFGGDWAQKVVEAGGFGLPWKDLPQKYGYGAVMAHGLKMPVSALKEMANTPGSSIQLYPRGTPIPGDTMLHEAGHALRLARGDPNGIPKISPEKAASIIKQAWEAGILHGQYRGDDTHTALDALARLRMGGFRVR